METLKSDIGIVRACEGCSRIQWDQICTTYLEPKRWWMDGNRGCPFSPRVLERRLIQEEAYLKKLNPLKASKRGVKGK